MSLDNIIEFKRKVKRGVSLSVIGMNLRTIILGENGI